MVAVSEKREQERLTEAQRELAGRPEHVNYAHVVASQYARSFPWMADELKSAACYGLVRAAMRFDATKGKFLTIADPHCRAWCRREVRKQLNRGVVIDKDHQRHRGVMILHEEQPDFLTPEDRKRSPIHALVAADELQVVLRRIPAHYRVVVEGIHLHGKTQTQLAEERGYSRARVGKLLELAMNRMRSACETAESA